MIYISRREDYSRVFPPLNSVFYLRFRRVVTPLYPLKSPILKLQYTGQLPPLFSYVPARLSPVLNQGKCGACYAFVIASLMSDMTTINAGEFGKNLSVNQITDCYSDTDDACAGAVPEDVLLWLQRTQMPLSVGAGFASAKRRPCRPPSVGISVAPSSVRSLVQFINDESIREPTPAQRDLIAQNVLNMKRQLVMNGPIFASVSVYKDLFFYVGNDVYEQRSDELMGGHAVEIVGYVNPGVDARPGFGGGYWIVRNSWGQEWPPNGDVGGYFFVRMGSNECGIEARCGCIGVNVKKENAIRNNLFVDNYNDYRRLLSL